jgi:HlyD family secretion protein/adhesin transport system membrane fusion protein
MMLAEEGLPKMAGKAAISVGVLAAILVVWAGFIEIDDRTRVGGRVVAAAETWTVSHAEGGMVAEILVKDGDVVEEGQALIRLDARDIIEKTEQMKLQHARMAMLAAELSALGRGGKPDFSFALPEFRTLVDKERLIFASLRRTVEKRERVLGDRVKAAKEKLENIVVREKELSKNAELLEDELQLREDLFKKGLTAKTVFTEIKIKADQARRDLADLAVSRKNTGQVLVAAQKLLNALKPRLMERALDELATLTTELDALGESLENQKKRLDRLEIITPVKGVVKGVNRYPPGAALVPGAAVLEIAPIGEATVIEARISPADIERVRPGQTVAVRVKAPGFKRFGGITGRLKEISPSTFRDAKGKDYYKGTIVLDRVGVGPETGKTLLKPGMDIEADIKTGSRSLIATLWN